MVRSALSWGKTGRFYLLIEVLEAQWGECGKAFIVARQCVDLAELQKYCRARLAKFKGPKSFKFLKDLPKNDTGKIDRKALKTLD
ncbi:MAG: hypothetical protein AAFV80_16550 [Bacteroidota bacterium]